ncbi:MAG: glycosyltransferase family 2 protein [Spirochaetota bacterium]
MKPIFDQLIVALKFVVKYFFYYRVSPKRFEVRASSVSRDMVSVVIPTHGVLPLARRCIENAIRHAGHERVEFIIYNNNAGDDAVKFLSRFRKDRKVRVMHSPVNTGLNAYHHAFKEAHGKYFVALDHDVIRFPEGWLSALLHDYRRIPAVKWLAADVIGDRYTDGAKYPMWTYQRVKKDGLSLLFGAVGGWCAMTDRALYEETGGFSHFPDQVYFLHDKYYIRKLMLKGYKIAIDERIPVYHARGLSERIMNDANFRAEFFRYVDSLDIRLKG